MYRHIWTMELEDPGNADAFKEHWRKVSHILQKYPGAIRSILHTLIDGPADFLMIGEWESEEARRAMHQDLHSGESELAREWGELPPDESFGRVTRIPGVELETITISQKTGLPQD